MPQTKFVLGKALKLGLRPILVLNKVDRPHADPDRVLNDTFDLFAAIGATDDQLDFPHIYASGKEGWAVVNMDDAREGLAPLYDLIVKHVPPPKAAERVAEPGQMLAVLVESDPFLGRLLTGRVEAGKIVPGMAIKALSRDGKEVERGRVTKILAFRGLKRQPIELAEAGDIVAIAGLSKATVADTLCDPILTEALPAQPIDPPTISMLVTVNDSPLAGKDGDKVQSRVIRDRLLREAESNVAIKVRETDEKALRDVRPHLEAYMNEFLTRNPAMMSPPGYSSVESIKRVRAIKGYRNARQSAEEIIEKGMVIVGSPNTVREKLAACQDRGRFNISLTKTQFGTMPHSLVTENQIAIAEEILPYFRNRDPQPTRAAAE